MRKNSIHVNFNAIHVAGLKNSRRPFFYAYQVSEGESDNILGLEKSDVKLGKKYDKRQRTMHDFFDKNNLKKKRLNLKSILAQRKKMRL